MAKLALVANESRHTVASLKEFLAQHSGRVNHQRRPSRWYAPGIPKGALTEVSGSARTAFVLSVLSDNPETRILWLEENFGLFPPHIQQLGIDLSRFAFVEAKAAAFPVIRKALRSQVFDFIISGLSFEDERIYKALRLLSEKAGSSVFIFCREHQAYWTIALQLEANWMGRDGDITVAAKRDKATDHGA